MRSINYIAYYFGDEELDVPVREKHNKPSRFNEYKRHDPKRDKHRKNDYRLNRERKREVHE